MIELGRESDREFKKRLLILTNDFSASDGRCVLYLCRLATWKDDHCSAVNRLVFGMSTSTTQSTGRKALAAKRN